MEIVTQWTARRTYPELLQGLGGKAAHLDAIKEKGLGYGLYIKNFDRLLGALKIDESALLTEMKRLVDATTVDTYQKSLADWRSGQSGRKKGAISKAISAATDKTMYKERFEEKLKELGLLPEEQG